MAERVLYLIGCAAPPVQDLATLVDLLQARGWRVCVVTTPTAAMWIDAEVLAERSGHPVHSRSRRPDEESSLPKADALLLCPATFNTLNKWAAGISDTLALGLLNEAVGLRLPVFAVPYVKSALAAHPAFNASLERLAGWGVTVLTNELMRPPNKGDAFLWGLVAEAVDDIRTS